MVSFKSKMKRVIYGFIVLLEILLSFVRHQQQLTLSSSSKINASQREKDVRDITVKCELSLRKRHLVRLIEWPTSQNYTGSTDMALALDHWPVAS